MRSSTKMNETVLEGNKIATTFYEFEFWQGEMIDNYGGKAILNFNGKPLFAELAALHMFTDLGFQGVWVDTFRNKYRNGLPENSKPVCLPAEIDEKLKEIIKVNGTSKGVWDLLGRIIN